MTRDIMSQDGRNEGAKPGTCPPESRPARLAARTGHPGRRVPHAKLRRRAHNPHSPCEHPGGFSTLRAGYVALTFDSATESFPERPEATSLLGRFHHAP